MVADCCYSDQSHDIALLYFIIRAIAVDYSCNIAYNSAASTEGGINMVVSATEFKVNFGKYLSMLATEDIFITKNGKKIAKVWRMNTFF